MRDLVLLLMLLLAIVIESAQMRTSAIRNTRRSSQSISQERKITFLDDRTTTTSKSKNRSKRRTLNVQRRKSNESCSEGLDVGLRAQAGEPAFLQILCLLLKQFLFDVGPGLFKRLGVAAVLFFDFENVVVAAEVDDVANFAGLDVKLDFLQGRSQRFSFDPAPVPAFVARAVFGIKLSHALELGAIDQFPQNLLGHRLLSSSIPVSGMARNHDQA